MRIEVIVAPEFSDGALAGVFVLEGLTGFDMRGKTFGTTTDGGVCITFDNPVRGLDPLGVLRHPGLTVTVEDRTGLMTMLRERAGLSSV